jgi:hypothetical protein
MTKNGRSAMQLFTFSDRPDLAERVSLEDAWEEFLHHAAAVNRNWEKLLTAFADYQLVLYDEETDHVVGKGHTIPFEWDGTDPLPEGGVEAVLESGVTRPRSATALSAIAAVVERSHQGRGLSQLVLTGMRRVAERHRLAPLVAPVRPTWKSRYPLTPFERYIRWTRDDGLPFDPWIRVHHRLGGEVVSIAPCSLTVEGTVAEWETWTRMAFPESGDYVVPGALVPVRIDRCSDVGRYVEPNVWMRHAVAGV